jgi:hypothetical protein
MAMPFTWCPTASCVCPAVMTSTNPLGRLLATEKISDDGSHSVGSAGRSNCVQ